MKCNTNKLSAKLQYIETDFILKKKSLKRGIQQVIFYKRFKNIKEIVIYQQSKYQNYDIPFTVNNFLTYIYDNYNHFDNEELKFFLTEFNFFYSLPIDLKKILKNLNTPKYKVNVL